MLNYVILFIIIHSTTTFTQVEFFWINYMTCVLQSHMQFIKWFLFGFSIDVVTFAQEGIFNFERNNKELNNPPRRRKILNIEYIIHSNG